MHIDCHSLSGNFFVQLCLWEYTHRNHTNYIHREHTVEAGLGGSRGDLKDVHSPMNKGMMAPHNILGVTCLVL